MKLTNEWTHPLGSVTFRPGPNNKAVVDESIKADLSRSLFSSKDRFWFFPPRLRRLYPKL